MPIDLAITLVTAFGILFLGSVVYFHDRRSASNILFFFISLSTVFWAIANYFSQNIRPDNVLIWIRLVLFFAAPHAVLFFIFTYNFPNREIILNRKVFDGAIAVMILTMLAAISPFVFSNVSIRDHGVVPIPGFLMPLFAGVILFSLVLGIFFMIKKYLKAKDIEKPRWRLMLIGVVSSYLFLIITNFVLVIFFSNTDFIVFGPLYMLPTIIGMSYAILKHNLLNVKTIAAEILTFAILSISLFEIFTSQGVIQLAIKILFFLLFFVFGIFLIRSVVKEVEQREKLEILSQQKSEFLSFASHQVKSPMAGVKGFAQLIADGTYGPVTPEAKEKAQRIKEIADRTIALVNNFLDFNKIEEGKTMDLKLEDVDIVPFVAGMVEEFKAGIQEKGKDIKMQFEHTAPSLMVKIDAEKMRQVIQNLIDNSVKYTDHGYIKVAVSKEQIAPKSFASGQANGKVSEGLLIAVEDSGRGLSKELQSKLFGRYVRDEKTKNEVQGTGLGLYIAKSIVEAHKGKIWAESEGEGKGSRFYVRLPKS